VRRLTLALVLLLGAGAGGDVLARQWAEAQLEARIRERDPAGRDPEVRIESFPFLGRLLVSGEVTTMRASLADVEAGPVVFARVSVELRGVGLNRNLLVTQQEVELERLDAGTVEAELTASALSAALGVPVELAEGRATVTIAGRSLSADLAVEDGVVVVRASGQTLRLDVPEAPLLPCVSSAQVEEGRAVLRCTVDDIPPELLRAASRAVRQG
jgi:hypothetical protein